MWPWSRRDREQQSGRSPALAALAGASPQEMVREVLQAALTRSRADRVGVWLQQDDVSGTDTPAALRGLVREGDGHQPPTEWEKLSLDSPVPYESLLRGTSVVQEFTAAAGRPMFGLLIGLHRVLWTPIPGRDRLRGVLFSGWQKGPAAVPQEFMEGLAADLGLALELEEQQRLTGEREADLRLNRETLRALSSGASTDTILSRLVASCAALCAAPSAAGFAILGHFPAATASSPANPEIKFDWESGDATWTHGIDREPLAGVWRQALESGRTIGAEPPASWSASELGRLLAIPLLAGERRAGVLVCGMAQASSSLQTLQRLEFRASLSVAALERRRTTTELLRRVGRRQALLQSSAEATLLVDSRGVISAVNAAAQNLVERASPEPSPIPEAPMQPASSPWYSGRSLTRLFCEREQARVEEWLVRALALERAAGEEPVLSCESELLNGVRIRLHPPLAVGDDLAAVVLEPAEVGHTSQQDRVVEAELQHVLEWVEEGVLLFDVQQTIRGMNTRFAQIAGLSPEEAAACVSLETLIQRLVSRASDPAVFSSRWHELARATEGGTREEVHLARPVPRVLERSVRPVLNAAGQRLGRLEIYRDLTAQRVFQAKLLQTEKLAALGQMITGVAHELSNPLTSILGYSQRLLVRNDPAGRSTEAFQIHEEAERASAILRQLLVTARETAQPERKRVALNQVVQKAMELQRFGSNAERIRIELDLDPALPFVMGDSWQLQQVLMNLIGNARQAIAQENRPGTVRLRTARIGEHRLHLQVIDDGPGIPQAILARIFDPFFTTKPAGVGTGLGLSIVLSVVREHGGQVHVANASTGGAVFTIEFPVAVETPVDSPARPAPVREVERPVLPGFIPQANRPHLGVARASRRTVRVLVVEDEPTVARLIADVLEDEGMRVDVLLDGREALERAARESFDLIVCDMKMPGIDGQHFYRSLAQTHPALQDHFLFVTGDVLALQTQEFLERNRIPHLAKPFRVEELTECIHRLFAGRWTRAESAAAGKQRH
jgi:signal transduction histidine kinase/ActR/RegA family two-component response regulator